MRIDNKGKEMRKRILNICDPIIRCYNHHAFPSCIIGSVQTNNEWLYNKFLQLEFNPNCHRKLDYVFDYFYENEDAFIKGYYEFPSGLNGISDQCLKIIIDLIFSGSYVVGTLDEYYIKVKPAYQKWRFVHNYLLYGVDLDLQCFYSTGYMGEHIQWGKYEIGFDEFLNSLVPENKHININNFFINRSYKPILNVKQMIYGIESFLDSFSDSKNIQCIYGIEGVRRYFEDLFNYINEGLELHIPSIYCLLEYNLIMYERINYLCNKGVFLFTQKRMNELKKNVENYRILVNMYLKYNIIRKKEYGASIIERGKVYLEFTYNVLTGIIKQ